MSLSHGPSRRAERDGLPLGWVAGPVAARSLGFAPANRPAGESEMLTHAGNGHLLTVAPTGAGKGRSSVIPALLTYPGPTLTIDVKGENVQVAARRRRELGHRVVTLDPFSVLGPGSDGLNPFDLFALPGAQPDCDSEMLVELITGGMPMCSKDLFWDHTGRGLLTGLVGRAAEEAEPARRHLATVLDYLYADDVDYSIAVMLDSHPFENQLARQELVAYLGHESDKCRPSVRSTAQAFVKSLGSRAVRAALAHTTFDLGDWLRGEPMDVFLVFPPDKLDSHRPLLRLWLGTLLAVLLRRPHMPAERTLLLLDECAQLGTLPHLRTALTLLRGYGVQVWTFWQDLSQLRHLYPQDWETVLNNSAVVQAFGVSNGWMARGLGDVLGVEADDLLRLAPEEQVLLRPGQAAQVTRRVDYLTNRVFAGLAAPNPRYAAGPTR
jgi:type IV secretion system protein VirD4